MTDPGPPVGYTANGDMTPFTKFTPTGDIIPPEIYTNRQGDIIPYELTQFGPDGSPAPYMFTPKGDRIPGIYEVYPNLAPGFAQQQAQQAAAAQAARANYAPRIDQPYVPTPSYPHSNLQLAPRVKQRPADRALPRGQSATSRSIPRTQKKTSTGSCPCSSCRDKRDKHIAFLELLWSGFTMLTVGVVGTILGLLWGRNYPADEPYSKLAGFMLIVCPALLIAGFVNVISDIRRNKSRKR